MAGLEVMFGVDARFNDLFGIGGSQVSSTMTIRFLRRNFWRPARPMNDVTGLLS